MTRQELELLSENHTIIFYDGVCNLCNGFVNHIIRHDPQGKIKFCTLQDELATSIRNELNIAENIDSVIGLDNNQLYTQSDVLFIVARRLRGAWTMIMPFQRLPKRFRNTIYNWVAKNRYKWYGKRKACRMPSQDVKARFL